MSPHQQNDHPANQAAKQEESSKARIPDPVAAALGRFMTPLPVQDQVPKRQISTKPQESTIPVATPVNSKTPSVDSTIHPPSKTATKSIDFSVPPSKAENKSEKVKGSRMLSVLILLVIVGVITAFAVSPGLRGKLASLLDQSNSVPAAAESPIPINDDITSSEEVATDLPVEVLEPKLDKSQTSREGLAAAGNQD